MEKDKERSEVQVSRRFDLWIELDFDNNNDRVNFYQFKHYPDDLTRKVSGRKLLVKIHQ